MQGLQSILTSAENMTDSKDIVDYALETVRTHLGMDIGYLSEFVDGEMVLRAVSAPDFEEIAYVGNSFSLEHTYCNHILEGRLPEVIPDTGEEPLAQNLPITEALPIGSHISIPVKRKDGSNYGMFCCIGTKPKSSLNDRDLEVMRIFSALAGQQINDTLSQREIREEKQRAIEAVLENGNFEIVFQPICDLFKKVPIGFEALCRFQSDPYRSPDKWFSDARDIGLEMDLEKKVLGETLKYLSHLPSSVYLSINTSPELVTSGEMVKLLKGVDASRILVEITEHAQVDDYEALNAHLSQIKKLGARIAVDDAGAGYASLQHIVKLEPDVLKLDMSLTRNIDKDQSLRSLAAALVFFCRETGAKIVAEGIETAEELQTLKSLGAASGQGYFFSKPSTIDDAVEMVLDEETEPVRISA